MKFTYLLPIVFAAALGCAGDKLVVHEWGTFTAFQNEEGEAFSGINSDDELLPRFTHNIHWELIIGTPSKGIPRCHPDVTMRMETPIIYFHPPAAMRTPFVVDVDVGFRGGWLTQFYPWAKADAPGLHSASRRDGMAGISEKTFGTLAWHGLIVGGDAKVPETKERVWLAPREVKAAMVTMPISERNRVESEKYLFYRGVGHLNAPLRVSRYGSQFQVRAQLDAPLDKAGMTVRKAWLAHFRPDGACAFRGAGAMTLTGDRTEVIGTVPALFDEREFSSGNLEPLRKEIRAGLMEEGLFADEAEALLNTWEVGYFRRPGLRLFYLVPQIWTEHYVPLKVSVPSEITRVMVGRMELVTPEQRALLQKIAQAKDISKIADEETAGPFRDLGRFRNALVLDELKRRPTPALEAFVKQRHLEAFKVTGGQ